MASLKCVLDDVFLPKDIDLDSTEMDETEREVEYFKRYVNNKHTNFPNVIGISQMFPTSAGVG